MRGAILFVFSALVLANFVFAETNLGSGSSTVTFSGGVGCYSTGTLAYWIIGSNETVFNSSGNVGNCSKYYDSSIVGSKKCCPVNYDCNLNSGQCSLNVAPLAGCSRYNNSLECNSAPLDIAVASVQSLPGNAGVCDPSSQVSYPDPVRGTCLNYSICSCQWNSSSSKCGSSLTRAFNCSGPGNENGRDTCNWIESGTVNLCDSEGKIVVSYTASGSALGQSWCKNTNSSYPCSASLKLPFFEGFNFVLALLAIACVYFITSRKK